MSGRKQLPADEGFAMSHVNATEAAKKVRAVLRAAFPKTKISTTSHSDVHVKWSDAGPSLDEVKAALLTAPFVEAVECWNGSQTLKAHGHSIWLNCYNVAKREADQRDLERRQEEWAAQKQREAAAVEQAWAGKRAATHGALRRDDFREQPPRDPAVFEAFDKLRQRAEAEADADHDEGDRRPSWAPPLILGDELAEACRALGFLAPEDKPVGRLWAHFATPKRSGRYAREHISSHTLAGIPCRGFQLFAGGARGTMSSLLFEAQRETSGEWRFGPQFRPRDYHSPRAKEWERLIAEQERLRHQIEHVNFAQDAQAANAARLASIASRIAAIDAEDVINSQKRHEQQQLMRRALDLARARVLDFVGAPDAQMQLAGRLCGQCCRCWRTLIDPISLERGIGPDCYQGIINGIKRRGAEGERPERIALLAGMPLAFVDTVLSEAAPLEQRASR
jgi:hypothetical protein